MRRNSRSRIGAGENRGRRRVVTNLYGVHLSWAELDSRTGDIVITCASDDRLQNPFPAAVGAQNFEDTRIGRGRGELFMLRWAVIFLVVALIAAVFGFTGIASAAAGIAKFLFFLFLVVCVILFIAGLSVARRL